MEFQRQGLETAFLRDAFLMRAQRLKSSILDIRDFTPFAQLGRGLYEKAVLQNSTKKRPESRLFRAPEALLQVSHQRVTHCLRNRVDRRLVARMINTHGEPHAVLERSLHLFGQLEAQEVH